MAECLFTSLNLDCLRILLPVLASCSVFVQWSGPVGFLHSFSHGRGSPSCAKNQGSFGLNGFLPGFEDTRKLGTPYDAAPGSEWDWILGK